MKYVCDDLIHYDLVNLRFCPSVFFYLCTVIPSVWFLELDLADRRLNFNVTQTFGFIRGRGVQENINLENDDTLPVNIIFLLIVCTLCTIF